MFRLHQLLNNLEQEVRQQADWQQQGRPDMVSGGYGRIQEIRADIEKDILTSLGRMVRQRQ